MQDCKGLQAVLKNRLSIMITHDTEYNDFVNEHDKSVYVRSYSRVRFGELENVRQHFRSSPNC